MMEHTSEHPFQLDPTEIITIYREISGE